MKQLLVKSSEALDFEVSCPGHPVSVGRDFERIISSHGRSKSRQSNRHQDFLAMLGSLVYTLWI